MDKVVEKFIKHTIVNLEGALMKDDDQLTISILTNLANTVESYVEHLLFLDLYDEVEDTLDNPPEN